MNGHEAGCKTTGCVVGLVLVIAFFVGLLNMAHDVADKARKKRATVSATASDADAELDLPLLGDGIRRYAGDHADALPPLQTPDALSAALYPRYVADADTFVNARDNAPYMPNAALSGKKRKAFPHPETVTLLSEATPSPTTGARRVLRLDGSVAVTPSERKDATPQPSTPTR